MASVALKLIGLKIVFGVVFGLLADIIWNKTHKINVCTVEEEHEHFHGNCESCEGGILKSALRHTLKIFVFVLWKQRKMDGGICLLVFCARCSQCFLRR